MFKKVVAHGSPITARYNHRTIVHKNILYVLMGYDGSVLGDMYWTKDGCNWEKRSSIKDTKGNVIEGRSLFSLCKYNNRVYLSGGYSKKSSFYVTTDMVRWEKLQDPAWSGRHGHLTFSFQGKMWTMSGYDDNYLNDVWWTRDGVNWTQEPNAPWPGRDRASVIISGNKLIIASGRNLSGYLNDVWWTSDCRNWERANIIGESFPIRYQASLIADGPRLILSGGNAAATYYDDIWHTTNGVNWYNGGAGVGDIAGHSIVYFNNRYLIICGRNGSGYLNDIWETKDGLLKVK
jgi:hypothetical protein